MPGLHTTDPHGAYGAGSAVGAGCAAVDPIAMLVGGAVERLLQARLLRAAHNRCRGLHDDTPRGLPLLAAEDRALL